MLYREMIAGYSEVHTKHIKTLCRQNVEFFNVKPCLNKAKSQMNTSFEGFYT